MAKDPSLNLWGKINPGEHPTGERTFSHRFWTATAWDFLLRHTIDWLFNLPVPDDCVKTGLTFLLASLIAFGSPLNSKSLAAEAIASPRDTKSESIDFKRDILPIFAERCYTCHGSDKQKNGLRLDRKADALAGGDSGPAFIPGKSAESRLFKYIAGLDPEIVMPQKGDRLTTNQVTLIKAWIDAGAHWPDDADPSTLNLQPLVLQSAPAFHSPQK